MSKTTVIVTSDHATPTSKMAHGSAMPPLLITGKKKDRVKRLTETECKKGCLGIVYGRELLKTAKKQNLITQEHRS